MPNKTTKLGYFSLPVGTPPKFPKTFLFLDGNKKIRIGKSSGLEIPIHQFARSLSRQDITLTDEGRAFVKKAIKNGEM